MQPGPRSQARSRRRSARAAWLAALLLAAGAAPAAEPKEIAATVCAACHGEGGNSVVPTFPRLAGLQAVYLEKQLRDFVAGKRKSDVMAPILATVKESDLAGLAAWYAAQKPVPGKAGDEKLAAAGQALFVDGNTRTGVPACMGCHQEGGVGNERYPRLAGQHAAYAAEQMRQFKSGARNNDRAKVMRSVAERMSDDEIAAVAEYLAGLP